MISRVVFFFYIWGGGGGGGEGGVMYKRKTQVNVIDNEDLFERPAAHTQQT